MNDSQEKVRVKAYEIWERQGRTGNPEDHWHQAERELRDERGLTEAIEDRADAPEATVEDASPVETVKAVEVIDDRPKE
jgi:hypothetical protein